ncbi:MAG: efflux RND transporter periplasmic adaptor subunit [Planctomycetota bacterium]
MSGLEHLARTTPSAVGSRPLVAPPPSRWKSRVLLPGLLIAATLAAIGFAARDQIFPAENVRIASVVLKTVRGTVASSSVQASGWIEPAPSAVFVSALTDGVVEELLVLEGDTVARGQVVARLIREDAAIAVDRARAELEFARARVADRVARFDAATQVLRELVDRTESLEQARAGLRAATAEATDAQAMVQQARASFETTRIELERKRPLLADEVVAVLEIELLEQRLTGAEASVASALAAAELKAAREEAATARVRAATRHVDLLIEERRDLATAEAALAEARAEERNAAARLAEAELRLARTEVRSPASGVVMARWVSPGSRVMLSGEPHRGHIVHLYDPQSLQVRVDVPLADAALVGVGQEAEITLEVLPDRRFAGAVTRLVHQADVQKNTVEVKVAVTDPTPELKPEMLARVRFLVAAREEGTSTRARLFAPRVAVPGEPEQEVRALVIVEREGTRGRVEARTVKLGASTFGSYIEVESGLQPGDRIVVSPPVGLAAGARVQVVGEISEREGG